MPAFSLRDRFASLSHYRIFRGLLAGMGTALLAFVLVGLVYNSILILRLPQSGLKLFEIIWVSFTACVVLIVFATVVAALLEALGTWLTPRPRTEQWLREEVRRHHLPGMEVVTPGEELRVHSARGKAGAA